MFDDFRASLSDWLNPFQLKLVLTYGGSPAQRIAEDLFDYLHTRKFIAWIASRHSGFLYASQDFREEIDKRIRDSDILLMVWTAESSTSTEAIRELDESAKIPRDVFPFVEQEAPLPPHFNRVHNVDFPSGYAHSSFAIVKGNLERIRKVNRDMWKLRAKPA